MQMIFLVDFFSKYNQLSFDKRNRNFIAFMISFELLCMIILSQKIVNSVEQFVQVANHILNVYISKKFQTFVNDITIENDRNDHDNQKVVFKIRIDIKRSKIIILDKNSQFCMFDIKIIDLVCDETDRHSDNFKDIKVVR